MIEWMNDSEWLNVVHSVMHPFNHSKLFCSDLPGYDFVNYSLIRFVDRTAHCSFYYCKVTTKL